MDINSVEELKIKVITIYNQAHNYDMDGSYESAYEMYNSAIDNIKILIEQSNEARDYQLFCNIYTDLIDLCYSNEENKDLQLKLPIVFSNAIKDGQHLFEKTNENYFLGFKNEIIKLYLKWKSDTHAASRNTVFDINYDELVQKSVIMEYYDVLTNDDDEVLFALNNLTDKEFPSDNPTMFFDGISSAILVKNDEEIFVCDYLNKNVVPVLSKCQEVLIYISETQKVEAQEFMAKLVIEDGIGELAQRIRKSK